MIKYLIFSLKEVILEVEFSVSYFIFFLNFILFLFIKSFKA